MIVAVVVIVLGSAIVVLWRGMRQRAEALAQRDSELAQTREALARTEHHLAQRKLTDHDLSKKISAALVTAELMQEERSNEDQMFVIDQLTDATHLLQESLGFEVTRALSPAVEVFVRSARQHCRAGVELEITSDDGDLAFAGDLQLVKRIADNLLGNAAREARHCTCCRVTLILQKGEFLVRNPTTDPRIARRAIERRVSANGSTGMGLKIVDELSERLGWSVEYEVSESPAEVTARVRSKPDRPTAH